VAPLGPKRLRLLRDLLPSASRFAILVDPTSPSTESSLTQAQVAASTVAQPIAVVPASTSRGIDSAFASLAESRIDALLVDSGTLFFTRHLQVVSLSMYHRLPALYSLREFADAGGVMSYGTSIADSQRLVGTYAGRILKGEKPANLPVLRPVKFEFVINLNAARGESKSVLFSEAWLTPVTSMAGTWRSQRTEERGPRPRRWRGANRTFVRSVV
jgi:putative ABC transport system substrate-binding protein